MPYEADRRNRSRGGAPTAPAYRPLPPLPEWAQLAPKDARWVTGLNPCREAVRVHGRRLYGVLLEYGDSPRLAALERFCQDQGIPVVERTPRARLDEFARGAAHQGVAVLAPPLQLMSEDALFEIEPLLAIALDEIQDPQNFGATIRSATALAKAPIIWGAHSAAPLTPATFRASAGAVEYAQLCQVRSLTATLQRAASEGMQVLGLDARAPKLLCEFDLKRPTILVLGNEHEGLKRGVRKACTEMACLMPPYAVDSLNASVAAAVALYEAAQQRRAPSIE